MGKILSKISMLRRQFTADIRASAAMIFAAAAPILLGAIYVAVETAQVTRTHSKLQSIADSAAIAAAREMRLGNSTKDAILSVAKAVSDAGEPTIGSPIAFDGDVPEEKSWVSVTLKATAPQSLASSLGLVTPTFSATAKAKVLGGAPVCALALRESFLPGLTLDVSARMEARNCAVYSNSRFESSIWVRNNASLTAALICSGGGVGSGSVNLSPPPTTDCPALPDPLAARPPPPVPSCIGGGAPPVMMMAAAADGTQDTTDPTTTTGTVISGESRTLSPGTYCGGLTITNGSDVTLMSGVYVIKDGPLIVEGGSTLKGVNTGFYFTGAGAEMTFKKDSVISLTAPKAGPMAGLLLFQDRDILAAQPVSKLGGFVAKLTKDATDGTKPLKYEVSSDNASVLLGTIYLPKGRFYSGGSSPIGANSAYTIIVAFQINAESGPTLVLNSNYNMTDVPVPGGLGNLSNKVMLDR